MQISVSKKMVVSTISLKPRRIGKKSINVMNEIVATHIADARLDVGFPVYKIEGDDTTQKWNDKDFCIFWSMRAHRVLQSCNQKLNVFIVFGIVQ